MVFHFHYHKALSEKAGYPKLSLHYNKTCFVVNSIKCNVPVYSKNHKTQPHVTITGKAKSIKIKDLTAEIN